MLTTLMRPRCRIQLGEPDENGEVWASLPLLPALASISPPCALWPAAWAAPRTEVRALAGEQALYVRFDCHLTDVALLRPRTPAQPLREGEYVRLTIHPRNDPCDFIEFAADYRAVCEVTRTRRMPGECSLGAVADIWQATAPANLAPPPRAYHGLTRDRWWVELVIAWRALGLATRPVTLGFGYARVCRTGLPWPAQAEHAWPPTERASSCHALLEPGEALLGELACAPMRLEIDGPTFGRNTARLVLTEEARRAVRRVSVHTESGAGEIVAGSQRVFAADNDTIGITFDVDRVLSSHLDVFSPQRLVVGLHDERGALLYVARLPMDRHLGICVDEPYGQAAAIGAEQAVRSPRERLLTRIVAALPRLHRLTTAQGAPSDFCLVYEDGRLAVNLMADDAWQRLAEIVESRFVTTEERLVGAMALVGQKSVTNLILDPMFFTPEGRQHYHSCLHEMMGPLSIMRYGGGPAVARAAVLARLLQEVTDPAGGRPFATRVLSLTAEGGPRQVTRGYTPPNLAPFWQHPGRVGCVAVDYRDNQTLLDPTALACFVAGNSCLLTVEEMLADEAARRDGAGALAAVYARLDVEEMRRQPVNRLLSKGVFPELCPDEDGDDCPFDMRERQVPMTLAAPPGTESAPVTATLDLFGRQGCRRGRVWLRHKRDALTVHVRVSGVVPAALNARDRALERVHLALDPEHNHREFFHFMTALSGEHGAWREVSSHIQKLFKHLSTDYYAELSELKDAPWSATTTEFADSYEVVFDLPWTTLQVNTVPPTIGLNVWIEGRAPHYEQVFLSPSRWQVAADPFTFADAYLSPTPLTIQEIDLGVPTWGENTAQVMLANASGEEVKVFLQARQALNTRRSARECQEVAACVPPRGQAQASVPYFVEPSVKMAPQTIGLRARTAAGVFFDCTWQVSYLGPVSAYQRYGSELPRTANPRPGECNFLTRKIHYICSRLPRFQRLTTRDGAASDFVLRAEDGSAEFNLMAAGVLDQIGEYIAKRYDSDVDRLLGLFFLACAPFVARHMSWGHRIMNGAGPLTILRGNFAGGGGNCGFHARAFAGMAAHLKIRGRPLSAHVVSLWGHAVTAIGWRGSKVLMDADVGHFMMTPDGADLATIGEFLANPATLSTAGPDEVARLFTVNEAIALALPSIRDEDFPGVWPPSAPVA